MSAPVINLDEYRRDENGMYVPATEPAEVEHDQVLTEPADETPKSLCTESGDDGVTWRVRLAQRGSAVQQRLSEIPARQVIRRGSRVERAAELEELADDPRAEAYSNRRARFWLLLMAALGIALGVGISSSTAQQTITSFMGWASTSVAGFAAYGADPALGLVLFATLGARVLASARGVAVPERARRALNGIEAVLFGLVALLNAGPSLGHLLGDAFSGEWSRLGPDVMVLVIHTLGPVLVATGVFGIPYMALILSAVTAATNARRAASLEPRSAGSDLHRKKPEKKAETKQSSPASTSAKGVTARVHRQPQKKSFADHEAAFYAAVEAGEIDPGEVSANGLKDFLRCQWPTANKILTRYQQTA